MLREHLLLRDNMDILHQGLETLDTISDEDYNAVPFELGGQQVGGHFRHCLEFYECFLEGLASGMVDYDARRRDHRLACDRRYAQERLCRIANRLDHAHPHPGSRPVDVRQDHREARSTVERELEFLKSHTVHHFAIVALLLRLRGRAVDPSLGVAPATLTYWRQREAVCAQ